MISPEPMQVVDGADVTRWREGMTFLQGRLRMRLPEFAEYIDGLPDNPLFTYLIHRVLAKARTRYRPLHVWHIFRILDEPETKHHIQDIVRSTPITNEEIVGALNCYRMTQPLHYMYFLEPAERRLFLGLSPEWQGRLFDAYPGSLPLLFILSGVCIGSVGTLNVLLPARFVAAQRRIGIAFQTNAYAGWDWTEFLTFLVVDMRMVACFILLFGSGAVYIVSRSSMRRAMSQQAWYMLNAIGPRMPVGYWVRCILIPAILSFSAASLLAITVGVLVLAESGLNVVQLRNHREYAFLFASSVFTSWVVGSSLCSAFLVRRRGPFYERLLSYAGEWRERLLQERQPVGGGHVGVSPASTKTT